MIGARIASALRRTVRIALDRPRVAAWTIVAATSALVVAGAALVAADTADRWSGAPRATGGSMVVYLGEGIDDATAQRLATQLAALPGVEHADLVAPTESARRLQQALGADAALLDGVDLASLPGSVEVTLAPGVRDVIAMSPTLRALRGTAGIEDVVLEAEPERDPTPATVRAIAWPIAGVLAVLAIVIVIAGLRVRHERDAKEQRVLHLLGASPAFSFVPTALAGALLGLVAAALAALVVSLGIARFGDAIAGLDISLPAASAVLVFVALGAAGGLVGGGLAGAARVAR